MNDNGRLAEQFEAHRSRLLAAAYRMLGSLSEAEDAVQEAWFRVSRAEPQTIENMAGWLTTVVARICLDMLRSRKSRREMPLATEDTERIARDDDGSDPEREAMTAESVGLALIVVLDRLKPAERVAFVLHDVFAVTFEEIAAVLGRSEAAARQLASRARRRVRGANAMSPADSARRRALVESFLAAARAGDFDGLLRLLDPNIVLRDDRGAVRRDVRDARAVARRVAAARGRHAQPALVDGSPGIVVAPDGVLSLAIRFAIVGDNIAEIDVVSDPARLRRIDLAVWDG